MTIRSAREQSGRTILAFESVPDRDGAEALRGVLLLVDVEESEGGDDEWHDHVLVGLSAVRPDGTPLGRLSAVEHRPAQDLLVVRTPAGHDVMVPFVAALVPEVDVPGGRVVIDPPGGLFEPADDE